MSHSIIIEGSSKEEKYQSLIPQIKAILEGEADMVSRMANTAAALHEAFGFLWTGFYRVVSKSDSLSASSPASDGVPLKELAVGPFQGPVACSRIAFGKGVCGKAWKEGRTLTVPDVEKFPGHIRCSSAAKSEIVVPLFRNVSKPPTDCSENVNGESASSYANGEEQCGRPEVTAVLDIDSASLGTFDQTDARYLEEICKIISN